MSFTEQLGFFLLFFFSVVFRELCRGYTAAFFGDESPEAHDRLTLNPVHHIDMFGTIILPIVFVIMGVPAIGWAKPMPVSLSVLQNRTQRLLVIFSGMIGNIFLIIVSLAVIVIVSMTGSAAEFLVHPFALLAYMNIILVIFHIIPIPPLDGFLALAEIPNRYVQKCVRMITQLNPLVLFLVILIIWNILYPLVAALYAILIP